MCMYPGSGRVSAKETLLIVEERFFSYAKQCRWRWTGVRVMLAEVYFCMYVQLAVCYEDVEIVASWGMGSKLRFNETDTSVPYWRLGNKYARLLFVRAGDTRDMF